MSLELKKAIDQISKDKGLDRAMLIETLEEAVRTSVARKYGEGLDVEVSFNEETGEIDVFQFKIVVAEEDLEDEDSQISLANARKHDPSVQLDDEIGFRLRVEDLGRIAAQSARASTRSASDPPHAIGSSGANSIPVTPSAISSRCPPTSLAATMRPCAIASSGFSGVTSSVSRLALRG